MSRTFHPTSIYWENKELIERRKKRALWKGVPFTDEAELTSAWSARIEFARVMQNIKDGKVPMGNLRTFVEYTLDAIYRGDIPQDTEDTEHTIYSAYTKPRILALLNNNTMRTVLALEQIQPEFPLLTYTPWPKEDLSAKELQNLMNKVWWMVYMLLPPKEVIEVQRYVLMYCNRITQQIQKTHMHINIALARNPDEDIL